ncbi:BZ3500_MvSof-1268-A1-R1_Chr8-2g10211 [Microbotryum saponariae]|uniref:BZ3500_MvSof-1268-A1-R1_Chr8-2g10211 protein n=1 Tax=Microbotryum saponariae TaxID=289078 RepID=A0A2X0L8P8_9BASI|nr:BZ3500_MvSof-1268-A1-R1_Chr8-2g10211 [Microbotryum saponariae]SDA02009.1 BZ3501_MvSof-1269-A2-R1_Chr8-2g09961 [Microbotryum saponariae]
MVSSRKTNHLPHPNTTKQTERYIRKVAIPFPRSRTPLASNRDIGGEKRKAILRADPVRRPPYMKWKDRGGAPRRAGGPDTPQQELGLSRR